MRCPRCRLELEEKALSLQMLDEDQERSSCPAGLKPGVLDIKIECSVCDYRGFARIAKEDIIECE